MVGFEVAQTSGRSPWELPFSCIQSSSPPHSERTMSRHQIHMFAAWQCRQIIGLSAKKYSNVRVCQMWLTWRAHSAFHWCCPRFHCNSAQLRDVCTGSVSFPQRLISSKLSLQNGCLYSWTENVCADEVLNSASLKIYQIFFSCDAIGMRWTEAAL